MRGLKSFIKKVRNLLLISLIITWQTAFALVPILKTAPALAAPVCVNDTAGANDEPGQKDLTKLCTDEAGLPTSEHVTWNWDETGTSGANTLDGCALFDTDGDGNINYSVCVTTTGDPATFQSTTLYSCGDDKVDRCTSPVTPLAITNGTTCSVSQTNTDPFPTGASSPKDITADCTLYLADVGGGSVAKLIDVCSYPSAQPNSDPSDCVIIRPKAGKLEVVKDLVPNSDPGLFNLKIDGVTKAANVGDGGTTGENVVSEGDHTASETAGTNTALTNYTTHFECRDLNGTGSVVASGDRTGADSRQITVNIPDGSDIICVITNTRQLGTITLVKNIINNNGGNAGVNDFGLSIGGTSVTSGETKTLSPGSYAVNEAGLSGYQFVNITGTGCPTELGGNVTLANGQNITCTITNDDVAPQLTVIKHVVNNNGGSATADQFTMNVTGTNVSDSSFPGDEGGTTVTLNAGSFSVNEQAVSGYTGSIGANCSGSIALGEHKTCTITNDDQPATLVLVKNLPNDNGGTATQDDFNVYLNSVLASWGVNVVNAGSYTASEDTLTGYLPSGWSVDCNSDGLVSLLPGETKTCSITNDDQAPTLVLNKVVVNNNGGTAEESDWTLTATGPTSITGSGGPSSADVVSGSNFSAGTYTLSESGGLSGYDASNWSCTNGVTVNGNSQITLNLAQSTVCTITNNDQAPSLTLVKHVVNKGGSTAVATDWTLTANGPTSISGAGGASSGAGFSAGTYALSESGPTGFNASNWSCDGGDQNGASITIALGEDVTCEITNTRDTGTITVKKVILPSDDNGLFNLNISGYPNDSATNIGDGGSTGAVEVVTGLYSVNETAGTNTSLSDYNSEWQCVDGEVVVAHGKGNTSTIFGVNSDSNIVCTFINKRFAKITIVKDAQPNSSQSFNFTSPEVGDFSLVDNGGVNSKVFDHLDPGTFNFTEHSTDGWDLDNISCTGAQKWSVEDGLLHLYVNHGNNAVCTFTNKQLSKIDGHKFNDVNNNGVWDNGEPALSGWTIILSTCSLQVEDRLDVAPTVDCSDPELVGTTVTDSNGAYEFNNLQPNVYQVCEVGQTGWTQTYPTDNNGCHIVSVLEPGQSVTKDFGNHEKPVTHVLGASTIVNTGSAAINNILVGLLLLGSLGLVSRATGRGRKFSE